MKSNQVRDWLEIFGIFGVIVSLLFVGIQLKQDREIAASTAYQARAAMAVEFWSSIATDDVARSAMIKDDSEPLTQDETFAFVAFTLAGKEMFQNSHFQYENGYLDEEHWSAIRALIAVALERPISRNILFNSATRPSFISELKKIEAEAAADERN